MLRITPNQKILGCIQVPGDKSISHRAVILSAISDHTVTIQDLCTGEDVKHTVNAMRALGVDIQTHQNKTVIHGVGLHGLKAPENRIDCGNAGTTMRLLAGLLSAQKFNTTLIGDASLMQRPMLRVAKPLRFMGAKIHLSDAGTAPIDITGNQKLNAIDHAPIIHSAQVKSAILLADLYAAGKTCIREPVKTRDHTEKLLAWHHDIGVPGDISAAAFFIVATTITPGSDLVIRNVGINPLRTGVIEILKKMGAKIAIFNHRLLGLEPVADLQIRAASLQGIEIPNHLVTKAIDEFPIIFIAAAVAQGKTVLRNAIELRVKESDRIQAMAYGLKQLGVSIEEYPDGIAIQGQKILQGGRVDALDDHRIAMAFSVAGNVAKQQVLVDNADRIKTSFPSFIVQANQIGMNIL